MLSPGDWFVMNVVKRLAPTGNAIVEYDRLHLALYAALLEANDAGTDWREAAASLMKLDLNACDAQACWLSHLERARWIVGEGLGAAIVAFNSRASASSAD
jgi:hypothetical protein